MMKYFPEIKYFVFFIIEKGQSWFMDILQQATDDADRTQNINPKNCVGTVLALNGHRRYVVQQAAFFKKFAKQKITFSKFSFQVFLYVSCQTSRGTT